MRPENESKMLKNLGFQFWWEQIIMKIFHWNVSPQWTKNWIFTRFPVWQIWCKYMFIRRANVVNATFPRRCSQCGIIIFTISVNKYLYHHSTVSFHRSHTNVHIVILALSVNCCPRAVTISTVTLLSAPSLSRRCAHGYRTAVYVRCIENTDHL